MIRSLRGQKLLLRTGQAAIQALLGSVVANDPIVSGATLPPASTVAMRVRCLSRSLPSGKRRTPAVGGACQGSWSLRERLRGLGVESLAQIMPLASSDANIWTGRRRLRSSPAPISHTSVMVSVSGLAVGGDVEEALGSVGVPSYVLDETGVVRWINAAAEHLLGDIRGRHYTSVVAPEETRRARELFTEKMLGTSAATDTTGVLMSTAGTRVPVELSSVPLKNGQRVVGVFGLLEGLPDAVPTAPNPHLTPRQVEVLRLLEQGRSTKQIAADLHLSTETVRNHIRHLFRALGVNSRLEAVAAARPGSKD